MFAGLKQQLGKAGASSPLRLVRGDSRPAQRTGRPNKPAPPSESGLRRFFRETKSELKKVVWPTREQTRNLTVIVIAVSVVVGLIMGGIDLVFEELFQLLLGAR